MNRFSKILMGTSLLALLPLAAFAAKKSSVFFLEPKNGATVSSPVKVKMGVRGMTVKKAGEMVAATGHHHLIVDRSAIPAGGVVPKDETHIHFGNGQTETEIVLPPGKHKLTLQFADGAHLSYGEKMSDTIEVTVK